MCENSKQTIIKTEIHLTHDLKCSNLFTNLRHARVDCCGHGIVRQSQCRLDGVVCFKFTSIAKSYAGH